MYSVGTPITALYHHQELFLETVFYCLGLRDA